MDLVTPEFGLIFWQTITLLLVIFILRKFAWNPILAMVQSREEGINASISEAKKASDLVKELTVEKGKIVQAASLERDKILAEAFTAKNAILEEAKNEASMFMNQALEKAKTLIETERNFAVLELRQQVSDLSIQIAGRLLSENLSSSKEQTELIDNIIKASSFK